MLDTAGRAAFVLFLFSAFLWVMGFKGSQRHDNNVYTIFCGNGAGKDCMMDYRTTCEQGSLRACGEKHLLTPHGLVWGLGSRASSNMNIALGVVETGNRTPDG
jgi:hypothetical protein